jgi:cephalosporin hydroxylase
MDDVNDVIAQVMRTGMSAQKEVEIRALAEYLMEREPATIVELGVHLGGTTMVFRAACPAAIIVGVERDISEILQAVAQGADIWLYKGDSHEIRTREDVLRLLDVERIDFCFIDADHSFDAVLADWMIWSPVCAAVGFHDIRPHTGGNPALQPLGSHLVWEGLKAGKAMGAWRVHEFIDDSSGSDDTMGIGVIELV